VDARDRLTGFQFQSGLTSWPFLNMKTKKWCETIDEERKLPDADPTLSYFDEY